MKLQFRNNSLELEGYINVTERESELLHDKEGKFIEVVQRGCWSKAIENKKIDLLYNHNQDRKLGDTSGNLYLEEDNIGLKFKAFITDVDIIEKAKKGLLRACSFGFIPVRQMKKIVEGVEHRYLKEIELFEVSLLDIAPAYSGCSINIRSKEKEIEYDVRVIELEELTEKPQQEEISQFEEDKSTEEIKAGGAQEEIINQQYDNYEMNKMWLWIQKQNNRY